MGVYTRTQSAKKIFFQTLALFSLVSLTRADAVRGISPSTKAVDDGSWKFTEKDPNANSTGIPFMFVNNCSETLWPALGTQHGARPVTQGFELKSGQNETVWVQPGWAGRMWARTNCSFPASLPGHRACETGDCRGDLDCVVSGLTPATLAEILTGDQGGTSFYDISLVDGYNLDMAISLIDNEQSGMRSALPPNRTNPSCVASVANFVEDDTFNPYNTSQTVFLGTNQSYPLAFNRAVTRQQISRWCPWDLQAFPPTKPGDGVYPYPDDNIQRPVFQPCFSQCGKYNEPQYCCTGAFKDRGACKSSLYTNNAKKICPDAYSFAHDDQKSTFTVQTGVGFQITMCPGGKSTKILETVRNVAAAEKKNLQPRSAVVKSQASSAGAHAESSTPPFILLTGAALIVVACVFSSL
ncbi:Osmotin, thaumatin-like protein [Microthyrium microscopicum]|uniref:Osmotin, thaumatin-like protein n=1 Tax=Microthyrium microscopicum TaxID=703497 RepID=A0A6A6TYG1_9PEZI|nr:Osmotin, thaumatin-like protein [Microthyrium microscopicum]